MRWGTAPLLLAIAGAIGGALDAGLSQLTMGSYGDEAVWCASIGGGIGLGIGAALCIPGRPRWGLLASPLLGATGYMMSMSLMFFLGKSRAFPTWGEMITDPFALNLAAPAAFILAVAHRLYLRRWSAGKPPWQGLPLYAALGALSGLWFWIRFEHPWGGLLNGALYGLVQHAGMTCVRSLDRWRVADPPA